LTFAFFLFFLPPSRSLAYFNQSLTEMQLTVGPVGPRGQTFRGSGKWCLCVRPNDRYLPKSHWIRSHKTGGP
jgi:hypothetical protein